MSSTTPLSKEEAAAMPTEHWVFLGLRDGGSSAHFLPLSDLESEPARPLSYKPGPWTRGMAVGGIYLCRVTRADGVSVVTKGERAPKFERLLTDAEAPRLREWKGADEVARLARRAKRAALKAVSGPVEEALTALRSAWGRTPWEQREAMLAYVIGRVTGATQRRGSKTAKAK